MNKAITNILRFLLLIVVQVLICNHIQLFNFINPYVYILAILLLPLEISKSAQYVIAFFAGFLIDVFSMTYGVHASASLLIAFVRPYLVDLLNGRHVVDGIDRPIPGVKNFRWLLLYTLILVFIHHFAIVLLETFNLKEFIHTLFSSIVNTIFTSIVILCVEYIFIPIKK